MRILISLIGYERLTGAELYVYEISRRYKEMGHDVLITAPRVGGVIAEKSRSHGVEVFRFSECPSHWGPDILHVNEYIPSIFALTLYPKVPAIATIHSQFDVEKPFFSQRIFKYICIRPQIQDRVTEEYGIPEKKTTIIYNGINFDRFSKIDLKNKTKNVLFVGTIDSLREKAIRHLISDAEKQKYQVTIVGKKYEDYLDSPPSHVKVLPPVWNIEDYLEGATETAGILLGRTTIEGWARGLPGWIYEIDTSGNILSTKKHYPPDDIEKFNIEYVANKIVLLYKEAIGAKESLVFDDKSLAEINAYIIAKTIDSEDKLLYQAGAIETLNGIVNMLGSQTDNLKNSLMRLEDELHRVSKKHEHEIVLLNTYVRKKTRWKRALKKIVNKSDNN